MTEKQQQEQNLSENHTILLRMMNADFQDHNPPGLQAWPKAAETKQKQSWKGHWIDPNFLNQRHKQSSNPILDQNNQ